MEFLTEDVKARPERVYLSAAEFSVNPGFHRNLTTRAVRGGVSTARVAE
jgi:hypothetical protein